MLMKLTLAQQKYWQKKMMLHFFEEHFTDAGLTIPFYFIYFFSLKARPFFKSHFTRLLNCIAF